MGITMIAGLMLIMSFIALIISFAFFLGHIKMVTGFSGDYKETDATLVGFVGRGLGTVQNPKTYCPILMYYNEYLQKEVKKEMINSGIINPSNNRTTIKEKERMANVGEKIRIQYTAKTERVIDKRFVFENKYSIGTYLIPVIISASVLIISFFMLIIGIVF